MEQLPKFLAMGVTEETFWKLNPRTMKPYIESHRLWRREQDEISYYLGAYVFDAVSKAIRNVLPVPKGKTKEFENYLEKPFFQTEIKKAENPESKEEVAVFEMKRRIKALQEQGMGESPM